MLFRQLFDTESSTYTYLLADPAEAAACLVDPVVGRADRDLQLLAELGLRLTHTLDTHVHADHVTAAMTLRERTGCQIVLSARAGATCPDVLVRHGDVVRLGEVALEVRETPGHTAGCVSYYAPGLGAVFTGDALLVRGCGRTDFQGGDARALYRSVHEQLFTLPDATLVYPAHDYHGQTASTIGEERRLNPRLGGGRTLEAFVATMAHLDLPRPRLLDVAVAANLQCGVLANGFAAAVPVGDVRDRQLARGL